MTCDFREIPFSFPSSEEAIRIANDSFADCRDRARTGADVRCSMGLVGGPNTGFFSLNRSGPSQKDGCMIAVSIKFPRTLIRCVHHWMSGRIIGLRLQCGVGRCAGTCISSVRYAPVHDERTQTSTSEALRIEFWSKLDGVIRQVPNRCWVI